MKEQLTAKLFIPILLLSLLTFGFSFDRFIVGGSIGVNTYLIVCIGSIFTIISLFLIKSLAVKYPEQSIIFWGNKLLGPIGKIGTPVWLIVIFLLTALLTRRVTDEVSTIILFRTPELVSTLAFLLLVGYMALVGEEALGRLSSVLMFMVPVFVALLVLSFKNANFLNVSPVNISRNLGYLRKWNLWLIVFTPIWILSSFNGNESLRRNFKTVILTVIGGTLILAATSVAIAGVFGPKGIDRYEWPVMSLMNITEFAPGYFFQNFATTIYSFVFLLYAAVTITALIIVIARGLTEFIRLKKQQSKLVLFVVIVSLLVLSFFTELINFKQVANIILVSGSFYTLGYIILIWFSSIFRRENQR